MKTLFALSFTTFLALSSAHATGTNYFCEPAHKGEPSWFNQLNLSIGRELQVSGAQKIITQDERGIKTEKMVDLTEPNLGFTAKQLSAKMGDQSVIVHMDFKGFGADEQDFTMEIKNDGSAMLTGQVMADCLEGHWMPIQPENYICHSPWDPNYWPKAGEKVSERWKQDAHKDAAPEVEKSRPHSRSDAGQTDQYKDSWQN